MGARAVAWPSIQLILLHRETLGVAAAASLLLSLPAVRTCPLIVATTMECTKVTTNMLSTYSLPRAATIAVAWRTRVYCFGLAKLISRKRRKQVATEETCIAKIIIKVEVTRLPCRPHHLRASQASKFRLPTIRSVELSSTSFYLLSHDCN